MQEKLFIYFEWNETYLFPWLGTFKILIPISVLLL